uniref:Uncharacterized protein n=1 Tax=Heliothis virescens TaxID=7102 RepID=A0A2A4JDR1_HELVI
MVERAPQTKQDEQYPLLKVDGGGDGGVHQQASPTLVAPGWGVTCSPKQSWLVRWPEYISACWMTLILLGISFLVFYALGMEVYRKQPVLIIKCNTSKPASDVYYHHIVQRGSYAPFMLYADYLSNVATQYPELHFHVFFLMDDSLQTAFRGPRHARFINKLIPYTASNMYSFTKLDDNSKRDITDFERRYQNVNVTIMSLSKYMAMTPLKYKWRTIPLAYLPFYARVFSVWQNGGVAMDLNNFNNNYNNRQHDDRRITAILKQHNDGIKVEEYTSALNKIDREEESEFFTVFYGLIHQILNETRTFLTKSFPFPQVSTEKGITQNEPLIRTNRNKRDVSMPMNENNITEAVSHVYVEIMNSTNDTDLKKNEYQTLSSSDVNLDKLNDNINDAIKLLQINKNLSIVNSTNKTEELNKTEIQTEVLNKSDTPQVVLFYDFSLFSDGIAPSFVLPEPLIRTDFRQNNRISEFGKSGKYGNTVAHLLSIDSEGLFVAASSRLHPFLGHLITAGCQRMQPKFAIQDTILTQCSGIFKEDTYCNNIYLL